MEMARCHGLGNGGRPPDEREATRRGDGKIEGKEKGIIVILKFRNCFV